MNLTPFRNGSPPGLGGGDNYGAGTLAGTSTSAGTTVNVHLSGDVIGTDAKSLAKYLASEMLTQLKAIQARSIGPILGK